MDNNSIIFWVVIFIILIITVCMTIFLINTYTKKETFVNFNPELVKEYSKKPKFKDGKTKVYIIFVNNSKNISKNAQNILNILKQSIRVDLILFALPLKEETSEGYKEIPDWIRTIGPVIPEVKSKSNRWKDTGILTHSHLCKTGNNIGIVLNDKFSYDENYIEQLLNYHDRHNDYIIIDKNRSILFKPEYYIESKLLNNIVLPKDKTLKYSP